MEVEGEVKLAETNLQIEREDVESRSFFGRENNRTRSQNFDSSWKFGSLSAALQCNLNPTTQNISPTGQHTSSSIIKDLDLSVLQNSISLVENAKYFGQYALEQINSLVPNVTWSCQHTKPSIAQNPNPPVLNV